MVFVAILSISFTCKALYLYLGAAVLFLEPHVYRMVS